jgi:hypothetical protein
MKKPVWIDGDLAERFDSELLSGPKAPDQDWRPTEIREIPGTAHEVDCVFVSQRHGEHTVNIPVDYLDDALS